MGDHAEVDPALVQAAEQEMCRSAPEKLDGSAPSAKRQKVESQSRELRFDYRGETSLSEGASGFLVMCSFRREKSATREAVQLLEPFLSAAGSTQQADATITRLKPVKLACEGVVFLRLVSLKQDAEGGLECVVAQDKGAATPTAVLERVIGEIHSGARPPTRWCQRVLPVETTCSMTTEKLKTSAKQLLASMPLLTREDNGSSTCNTTPVRFAVSYKERGGVKEPVKRADIVKLLAESVVDRYQADNSEEDGGAGSTPRAVVDIKNPEILLVAEMIPVRYGGDTASAGAQDGAGEMQAVCALCVIGANMITSKNRTQIKGLSMDSLPDELKKKK